MPTGILPEQTAVNPPCSLTGKPAGRMEGREDGGRGGCREAVAVTEPRSEEAPGTVLVDNFANKQRKPDPGEVIKVGHDRGEQICSPRAVTRHFLPGCKGHPVPTDSKFALATQ